PCFVIIPILATISCSTIVATIEKITAQSSAKPNPAPARVAVVTVPGPMNDAVMMAPGPNIFNFSLICASISSSPLVLKKEGPPLPALIYDGRRERAPQVHTAQQ